MLIPSDTPTRHDRHGCYPATVRLLPVSKTKPENRLRMAHTAGCRVLGENKVQEAYRKWEAMQDLADLHWSVIGHLQTNKATTGPIKPAPQSDEPDDVDTLESLSSVLIRHVGLRTGPVLFRRRPASFFHPGIRQGR